MLVEEGMCRKATSYLKRVSCKLTQQTFNNRLPVKSILLSSCLNTRIFSELEDI